MAQLDLFDNPLDKMQSAQVIAHKLKNHRIKMYKRCNAADCKNEIINKPWHHYCIDHKISYAAATSTIIGFEHPFVSSPVTKKI